ncbi:capsid [uncultured virus]|uniref:Capsid n=1 Tax=uncultured virus TaxID=340016 RepID=A0A2K9LWX7_9VIRU|nr:capsid [uncultured virus]
MPRRYRKRKRSFRKRRARGMQRIRTYRYKSRNIGGDRARAKLFFSSTANESIAAGARSQVEVWCPNIGATPQSLFPGIALTFGNCPGLSTLANQFLRYRIRGIKVKYTIYPIKTDSATHEPVFFYVNAQSAGTSIQESDQGPVPPFPAATIFNTPEQRWAKYAPVKFPMAGASPTRLTVYYSVNKVFGPDAVVKNDESFTGQLRTTFPYWDNAAGTHPVHGIWIQHGVCTISNNPTTVEQKYVYVMQATLYTEFFGRRVMTE